MIDDGHWGLCFFFDEISSRITALHKQEPVERGSISLRARVRIRQMRRSPVRHAGLKEKDPVRVPSFLLFTVSLHCV